MLKNKKIMSTNDTTISFTEKGVVNVELVKYVRDLVEEDLEIVINMESMIDPDVRNNLIQDVIGLMIYLQDNEVISQWDVMCDRRNNSIELESNGIVNFYVKFKQWNCLNYTTLEYQVIRRPRFKKKKKSKGRVIL